MKRNLLIYQNIHCNELGGVLELIYCRLLIDRMLCFDLLIITKCTGSVINDEKGDIDGERKNRTQKGKSLHRVKVQCCSYKAVAENKNNSKKKKHKEKKSYLSTLEEVKSCTNVNDPVDTF